MQQLMTSACSECCKAPSKEHSSSLSSFVRRL